MRDSVIRGLLYASELLLAAGTALGDLAYGIDPVIADAEVDLMMAREELDDDELVAATVAEWKSE